MAKFIRPEAAPRTHAAKPANVAFLASFRGHRAPAPLGADGMERAVTALFSVLTESQQHRVLAELGWEPVVAAIPAIGPDPARCAPAALVCQACAGDAEGGKCRNPKCVGGPIVRELVPAESVDACPDCHGTGEFESALHSEKCSICGGTGRRNAG